MPDTVRRYQRPKRAFDLALPILRTAVDGLREEGRLGHLPRGLMLYGTVAARLADWEAAMPAADEGRRLAIEFGEPLILERRAGVSGRAALEGANESIRVALAELVDRASARTGLILPTDDPNRERAL